MLAFENYNSGAIFSVDHISFSTLFYLAMNTNNARIIPALRYKDAAAAIDWLCQAFGFEKHLVVEGDHQVIQHAQLVLGNSMVMLGSARDDEYGRNFSTPDEVNGKNTQAPYLIVDDIDAIYHKVMDIEYFYSVHPSVGDKLFCIP